MALYGGIVFGPVATGWYKFLQHRIVLPNKNVETLARVACDQAFFAPVHLGVFLSSMAVMEGSDPMAKINTAYFPAIINNLLVWPWVQLINFKYVPLQYRVLVVNVVALGQFPTTENSTSSLLTLDRMELLSELY
ncbi:MAG: Protein required for ethanol metabolism [Trizodia sp. TS-e1964]|nr:MAG: Protein required for ethanol metabolism [Trizodia sp. TS-e1964]